MTACLLDLWAGLGPTLWATGCPGYGAKRGQGKGQPTHGRPTGASEQAP